MARKDALLKLIRRLTARRDELLRSISDELQDLRSEQGGAAGRDDVDVAADSMNSEMVSQLAQIESRELAQIERALARLRSGAYGTCEGCGRKIPVARLNALPYSTCCIKCQRELEENPHTADPFDANWQKVFEAESSSKDVAVNLAEMEYNIG